MIQSLAGVELRLANPWSGMARIRDAGTGEVLLTTRESEFSLKTTASQILVLDREESPWTLDQPQP
jgi:hypothetical protein